ncbi:MAG: hypothetical protein H8E55_57295 [Pelagibacterales bacterium]|nr:hypothetical protein [Pelagibacterales bacterium]
MSLIKKHNISEEEIKKMKADAEKTSMGSKYTIPIFVRAFVFFLIIFFIVGCGSKDKFEISSFIPNTSFEFHEHSMIKECKDPSKRIIKVIDENTAEIYIWHKGCPNNRVTEEKLIYNYRADDASNWDHEYSWLSTDDKVIILENKNAGYYNGYMHLSKRYLISNAYKDSKLIEARLFQQLDKQEYPSRNEVFTSHGGLNKVTSE